MDEIEELVPLYRHLTRIGLGTEDLEWAEPESSFSERRRLYKGLFPSGFGRFSSVEYTPPANMPGDGYPLTLLSGTTLPHFGGGTRSLRASRLKRFSPHSWVEMSDVDVGDAGFGDGDIVKVVSPVGEVTAAVRVTDTLPSGTLFMPVSFPESPVNGLFGAALDPRSKTPSLKACAVRLERTSADD